MRRRNRNRFYLWYLGFPEGERTTFWSWVGLLVLLALGVR